MKWRQPLPQSAVVSIDVLHLHGATDADAGTQVDGLMADAWLACEGTASRVAIGVRPARSRATRMQACSPEMPR